MEKQENPESGPSQYSGPRKDGMSKGPILPGALSWAATLPEGREVGAPSPAIGPVPRGKKKHLI